MKPRVLVGLNPSCPYVPEMRERLAQAGIETVQADLKNLVTEDGLVEQATGFSSVIACMEKWTDSAFNRLPDIRCIVKTGVGLDTLDVDAATRHGVPVSNTPGKNSWAVAEMAVTAILSMLRRTIAVDRYMRSAHETRETQYSHEMPTLTIGLLGFGNIAQRVAKMLSGFGCRIIASDLYPDMRKAKELNVSIVAMEQVLREADIISIHMPLTNETHNYINRDTIATMKPDAMIVNTARGGIINEDDLYEALKSRRLQAAALDVTVKEPVPLDSPLQTLPNVQFSGHNATNTFEAMENQYMACAAQTIQFYKGEPIDNLVNPDYVKYL